MRHQLAVILPEESGETQTQVGCGRLLAPFLYRTVSGVTLAEEQMVREVNRES